DGAAAARDLWIALATKLRLLADGRTPGRDVSIDTRDRAVTLFGMVPSAEAKAAAEEDAWKTSGVKRVVNQLQVVPPSKQEAVKAHDASVERAVRKALAGRPELSDASIDVDVENGVARLTGTVPTEEQRLTAGLAARSVTGLKSVHDDLRVRRRPWPRTPEHGPHEQLRGLWVGWPGSTEALSEDERARITRQLTEQRAVPVWLEPDDVRRFYEGFSNGVLWPLFHYLVDQMPLHVRDWGAYERV